MAYYQNRRVSNRPSVEQVTLIHTLAHKLGWSDNRYHDELERRYHAASCKNLTRRQTHDFINYLKAEFEAAFGPSPQTAKPAKQAGPVKQAKPVRTEPKIKATPGRLTEGQIKLIRELWLQVSDEETEWQKWAALPGFVKRQTGCDFLRFVPREKGPALICALKKMLKDKHEKEKANG